MDLRLAAKSDLPQLRTVYKNIVDNMYKENVQIWDDFYPCELFHDDIENRSLYILTEENDIVAAFALCQSNDGEEHVAWKNVNGKALYIDRFGVNVNYQRQGIGGLMLQYAMALARAQGAEYLRLFVVDINRPAINLYLKNGFTRADGIYEEKIDDVALCEYGFEIEI